MIYLFVSNWLFIAVLMTLAWVIYLKLKNPGLIDLFWPISILLSGLHYYFSGSIALLSLLPIALLILWAFRLAAYLFITRIKPNLFEKRYAFVTENSNKNKNLLFFIHHQFQGFLAMFIALPFYFIGHYAQNSILIYVSSALILIFIAGESLADIQLQQFRATQPKKVCNIGLWQYSRHPNYFFEWLIWLGFALAGSSSLIGLLGFLSPFLLLFLMLKLTLPITEQASIKSRGTDYLNYQKKVPAFFPKITKEH